MSVELCQLIYIPARSVFEAELTEALLVLLLQGRYRHFEKILSGACRTAWPTRLLDLFVFFVVLTHPSELGCQRFVCPEWKNAYAYSLMLD